MLILLPLPTAPPAGLTITLPDGKLKNEWGMIMRNVGIYSEFVEFPLAHATTKQDILNYTFPRPKRCRKIRSGGSDDENLFRQLRCDWRLETMFFEMSWYLTGMEKFLMDLMLEEEYQAQLMDTIMNYIIVAGKKLIEMGVDILWCGDDFGSQQGMIMDPETWRSVFKPRIKYMFEEFRKVRPDIKIAWHSCGSILPIIPDFIEIGLDILNPIQPLAHGMEPLFLKNTYGKDLTFFGGIDVQQLLPYGNPQTIRDEVRRRIDILGKGGGYIVAPAHNIQPDTPIENVMAFFDAVINPG
ncbi:MAG: hypothetical protein IPF54_01385 [Draconibacterium sp.]|nr:hypothetical protein [Draconibacterium sp.]